MAHVRINRHTYFHLLLTTLLLTGIIHVQLRFGMRLTSVDTQAGCDVRELLALPWWSLPYAVVAALLSVPRLRDCGMSGAWAIALFPLLLVGLGWLGVVILLAYPGSQITTEYGPEPGPLGWGGILGGWLLGVLLATVLALSAMPPMGHSFSSHTSLAGDRVLEFGRLRNVTEAYWDLSKRFPPPASTPTTYAGELAQWYGYELTSEQRADGTIVIGVSGAGIPCNEHGTVTWIPGVKKDKLVWRCTSTIPRPLRPACPPDLLSQLNE